MIDLTKCDLLFKANWISLYKSGRYEFMHRHRNPKAVFIIALTNDNKLVSISQFRIPHDCRVLETPAGLVEDGEDIIKAAERELLEETGYTGKFEELIKDMPSSPGINTECVDAVVFTNCQRVVENYGIDEEDIKVLLIDPKTIIRSSNEYIVDLKFFASCYLANQYIDKK